MALSGKTAIVTGSSSGIGAGIAEYFAKEGAHLSLTGRNEDNLEAVAKRCQRYSSEVITTVGDITDDSIRRTIVQKTIQRFRRIDILVNNAGISLPKPLTDVNPDDYDEQMNVNLRSPVLLTALAAPHLIESKGCVLNISSIVSTMPPLNCGVYGMTKAGLDAYTKTLARELGPSGVRVNSLNAGYVRTQIIVRGGVPEEEVDKILESRRQCTPLRRIATAEEMGKIAAFLVSDSAGFITGENLVADGGLILMPGF